MRPWHIPAAALWLAAIIGIATVSLGLAFFVVCLCIFIAALGWMSSKDRPNQGSTADTTRDLGKGWWGGGM